MTLTRKFGNRTATININDLDTETKVILLYNVSADTARQKTLSVRNNIKEKSFSEIEGVLLQMKNNYQLSYYDCVNSKTSSSTVTETTGTSLQYLSIVVCTKTPTYDYNGSYGKTNFFPQKNSEGEEDLTSYYLSNVTENGKDFIIDIALSNFAMGYIFGNAISTATMNFNYIGVVTPTVNIETALTNCNINKTVIDADTPTELSLTAESVQYIFNDTPTITINGVINNFIVSQDKQTATYTLTANKDDVISVLATAIFKYINITTNILDCGINKTAVEIGKTETLILTADTDLLFNSVPTITINDVTNNFIVSQDKKTATFDYTANAGDTVSVDATATSTPKVATITKNLVNCTMTPDVETYTEYSDLTLVFTCNENYSFSGIPYIDTNIYEGSTQQINATKINDNEYRLKMPKTAFTDISINYSIDVHATAIFNTETINKYGLICLYKPTKQNMIDLSKERFLRVGETDSYEDLGKYITSLKRIYLDVESIGTNKIILGNHSTNINADVIDDDDVIIELGNATITGEYNNEMDAKHTEIEIILPFISIVSLDAEKVMNKTINIKYKCNLITGVCIAYIYLVENDSLILLSTFKGVMGFDVPYILKPNSETIVNNSNVDASNIFNVPPKINIYENLKAETNNNIYDTFYIDTISNIKSGFVSIRKILSSNNSKIMLDDENIMIENILKNGFII